MATIQGELLKLAAARVVNSQMRKEAIGRGTYLVALLKRLSKLPRKSNLGSLSFDKAFQRLMSRPQQTIVGRGDRLRNLIHNGGYVGLGDPQAIKDIQALLMARTNSPALQQALIKLINKTQKSDLLGLDLNLIPRIARDYEPQVSRSLLRGIE